MEHRCHALGCERACPARWLMCRACWARVPQAIQREVYATVGRRGPSVDATWAPWWRAAHRAIHHVAAENGSFDAARLEAWLAKKLAFADGLETGRE